MRSYVKLTELDNVAVVTRDSQAGTKFEDLGVTLKAHKFALINIKRNEPVVRYGVILGYALDDIKQGAWINEHMLRLPEPVSVDNMPWGVNVKTRDLPEAKIKTFMGYRNPDKTGFAGTRNILGINTTVQCVQGVLDVCYSK